MIVFSVIAGHPKKVFSQPQMVRAAQVGVTPGLLLHLLVPD